MIWQIFGIIFAGGCLGGLVNSVVAGSLKLPKYDRRERIWYLGWLGNVLVGGVAAAVSWGMYGHLAQFVVMGSNGGSSLSTPSLRVGEIFAAVIIGIGGGRWLTAEAERHTASKERDSLNAVRKKLVRTGKDLDRKIRQARQE